MESYNHRLFYVTPRKLSDIEARILPAILNSTLVALLKHFYGRYAGTEGTLDTEIIDCLLLRGLGFRQGRGISLKVHQPVEARETKRAGVHRCKAR